MGRWWTTAHRSHGETWWNSPFLFSGELLQVVIIPASLLHSSLLLLRHITSAFSFLSLTPFLSFPKWLERPVRVKPIFLRPTSPLCPLNSCCDLSGLHVARTWIWANKVPPIEKNCNTWIPWRISKIIYEFYIDGVKKNCRVNDNFCASTFFLLLGFKRVIGIGWHKADWFILQILQEANLGGRFLVGGGPRCNSWGDFDPCFFVSKVQNQEFREWLVFSVTSFVSVFTLFTARSFIF